MRQPSPPGSADPTVPLPAGPGTGTAVVEEDLPPGPPPPPERPPRAIWPWLLALLVLVLAGLAALFFATRDNGKKTTTAATVTVPRVVGFDKNAAVARLSRLGFTSQVRPVASAKPKDRVLAQAPEAGAKLSRGGLVALTVSNGPPQQGVPNVVGLKVSAAIERLQAAHLDSRQKIVFAREAPGTVVRQKPAVGAAVKKGAVVMLEVSKGPQRVLVPTVVGRKRDDAVAALKKAGLVAAVFSVPATEPAETVVAQNPAPGSKALKGSRVRLNVATGPPATSSAPSATGTTQATTTTASKVTMPNVVGQTQLTAQRKLQSLGLRVRTFYVPSTKPQGTVVAQRPPAGTTLARDARARINVSNGPNPQPLMAVPDVTGEDEASATADLQAAGFQVQVFDQPTSDPNQDGVVLDEDPAPGTRIPRGSQVAIYVGRATS